MVKHYKMKVSTSLSSASQIPKTRYWLKAHRLLSYC